MTTSVTDITATLAQRKAERGGLMEAARILSDHYNGRITIPLPEINDKEPAAVANLIAQGIDQYGARIASHLPDIDCPPIRGGDAPEQRAKERRLSCYGWLETNTYDLLYQKRARQMVAYAGSPVWMRPNLTERVPMWDYKAFLEAFPSPLLSPMDMRPANCVFLVMRSWAWLKRTYPQQAMAVRDMLSQPLNDDDPIELAQWVDENEIVFVAIGRGQGRMSQEAEYGIGGATIAFLGTWGMNQPNTWAVELRRDEHRIGETPVVFPHRLSLDDPKGQFSDTLGMFQMQARLMALEVNAAALGVYPNEWMIEQPNQTAEIVVKADGLKGVVGHIKGATLQTTQVQPGVQTGPIMDRLERGIRLNGGIPADFGGESPTNVRTDARGQSVMAATVDFHVDEAQRLFGRALKHELQIAAAIDMAYWGRTKKSIYVTWGGRPGRVDYTPNDMWGEDRTILVTNAFSGLDINSRQVAVGQMVAGRQLSRESAMEHNPLIMDKFKEKARIVGEALEDVLIASLQQLVQEGQIHATDISFILATMRNGDVLLEKAVDEAQQRAQQRQATSGPPGTPEGPAEPGAPEAQPGLGQGGGVPPVQAPPPGLDNLKAQLRDLTAGSQLAGARYNGG